MYNMSVASLAHQLSNLKGGVQIILLASLSLFGGPLFAIDKDTQVPRAENLKALAETAAKAQQGIVLFFYSDHCGFCTALDREYLSPTIRSKEFESQIKFVRVQTDYDKEIVDFDGAKIKPSTLAQRYKAYVAPSLVFVDGAGKMRADTIHGYTAPDLFPGYVAANIEKLLKAIRGNSDNDEQRAK